MGTDIANHGAAAISPQESSTGLSSMGMGDYEIAPGGIFGGNTFPLALFLMVSPLCGKAVPTRALATDTTARTMFRTLWVQGKPFKNSDRRCPEDKREER